MATLHLLNQADTHIAQRCLTLMAATDGLILFGDAVYLQQHSDIKDVLMQRAINNTVYALLDDVQGRGLVTQANIEYCDYARFVALSCSYDNSVSW